MLRSLVLAFGLTCFLSATAMAQKGGGGGAPAPNPAPNPRPTPVPAGPANPANQPPPAQDQSISIRGRIIAEGVIDFPMLEVHIEFECGQPLRYAYVNSGGEFSYQGRLPSTDQSVYVIIQMDGFKTYRERVGGDYEV